jgi:hypothetical protein
MPTVWVHHQNLYNATYEPPRSGHIKEWRGPPSATQAMLDL